MEKEYKNIEVEKDSKKTREKDLEKNEPQNSKVVSNQNIEGMIYVTNKIISNKDLLDTEIQLIPKNIVLGIGCKKDKEFKYIKKAIDNVLSNLSLHKKSLKLIATVDIKKEEEGIKKAADYYDVPLKIIKSKDIKIIETKFKTSSFVKEKIGIGAVCEPSAYLGSNKKGRFLMRKKSFDGITIAVWEENESEN